MLSFCPALLGHTGWWVRLRICLLQWQKAYLGWLGSSRKLCYQVLSAMIWHIIVNLTSSSPLHLQTLRIWVATTTNMTGNTIDMCHLTALSSVGYAEPTCYLCWFLRVSITLLLIFWAVVWEDGARWATFCSNTNIFQINCHTELNFCICIVCEVSPKISKSTCTHHAHDQNYF